LPRWSGGSRCYNADSRWLAAFLACRRRTSGNGPRHDASPGNSSQRGLESKGLDRLVSVISTASSQIKAGTPWMTFVALTCEVSSMTRTMPVLWRNWWRRAFVRGKSGRTSVSGDCCLSIRSYCLRLRTRSLDMASFLCSKRAIRRNAGGEERRARKSC
jgi:hypothetical protein